MNAGTKIAAAGIALMALTATTLLPAVAARADDGRYDGRHDAPAFRRDVRDNHDARDNRDYREIRDDHFRRDAPRDPVVIVRRDPVVVVRHDDFRDRVGFRGGVETFRDNRTDLQETKNNDRNLATLGVVAAAAGVLTHNNTLTAVGAVGAIVGGTAYENARRAQNDEHRW